LVHPSAEHILTCFLHLALFRAGSSSAADDECRFLSEFLLVVCLLVADAAKVLEFLDVFGVEGVSSSDGDGREADKVSFFLILLAAAAALACAVLLDL
jgi:hypothetical protein